MTRAKSSCKVVHLTHLTSATASQLSGMSVTKGTGVTRLQSREFTNAWIYTSRNKFKQVFDIGVHLQTSLLISGLIILSVQTSFCSRKLESEHDLKPVMRQKLLLLHGAQQNIWNSAAESSRREKVYRLRRRIC